MPAITAPGHTGPRLETLWRHAAMALALGAAALLPLAARAQAQTPNQTPLPAVLQARVATLVQPLLGTLKDLVAVESGSTDTEGLARMAELVSARLQAAGMKTETLAAKAPDFHPQLKGAKVGSMVYGTKTGTGKRSVLLIAHMDTVYTKGMGAQQPFRIDGDRAYGLGISDDKAGVALILHTVALLQDLGFTDYAKLGVLINGDEEIGSPGSAALLTQLGSEYDAVFSFEGGGNEQDMVRLATSSIAIVEMRVTGRASHAGANPEGGRNALYEMAHQIMKTRQFGDNDKGLKINWTVANAGATRNVIPASATAIGDVRSLNNDDLDRMEAQLRESIKERLIPDTKIELDFYRSRPAFVANDVSRLLAMHALAVFKETGQTLQVRDRATGGGTDAAFAGLRPKGGVLESFGLRGFGAHSNDNEYIFISSIAPRLYLSTRMVMDVGSGALSW
jgi:glutamate carboxypeptidase